MKRKNQGQEEVEQEFMNLLRITTFNEDEDEEDEEKQKEKVKTNIKRRKEEGWIEI